MKKITLNILAILCIIHLQAQSGIEKETAKAIRLIERNLTTDERNPSRSYEYFIYNIQLDSNGSILHVDILRLDSSFYYEDVRKVIPLIRKKWSPVKSKITKILIPVLFINNNNSDNTNRDSSIPEMAIFFEAAFKKQSSPGIFVSKMSIITSYSSSKTNKNSQ
ncbi:MAG: hypothetical protein JNK14_19120 [Chitinophagaceae bacterium]|nr:hypothetical protein [Chitinophagaceae bacterium]